MEQVKGFTDLSQSRRLIEIGINPESADMYIAYTDSCTYVGVGNTSRSIVFNNKEKAVILPCWTLSALINLMPLKLSDCGGFDYYLNIDVVNKMPRYVVLEDCFHDTFPFDFEKDNLFDNIVESIIWMKMNNYI